MCFASGAARRSNEIDKPLDGESRVLKHAIVVTVIGQLGKCQRPLVIRGRRTVARRCKRSGHRVGQTRSRYGRNSPYATGPRTRGESAREHESESDGRRGLAGRGWIDGRRRLP
jgi:hypothetical protein